MTAVCLLAFGPTVSAGAAIVSFPETAPEVYIQGSGEAITFELSAALPDRRDVLVLAWSHERQALVEGFGHRKREAPWQIEPVALDTLPHGAVQLQVHVRAAGGERHMAVHELEVQSAPVRTQRGARRPVATIDANGAQRATDTDGSADGGTQTLAHDDEADADTDDTTGGTHLENSTAPVTEEQSTTDTASEETDTDDTATHSASRDEQLAPSGGRVNVPTVGFASDTPTRYVQGSGASIDYIVDGEMPHNSDVLVMAWSHDQRTVVSGFAERHTDEPWRISAEALDTLPAGGVQLQLHRRIPGAERTIARHEIEIEPAAAAESPTIAFASAVPGTYEIGSGASVAFELDGELPDGADVIAIAWSDAEQRMVDEFAHRHTEAPWRITSDHLDLLPAGGVSVQLLLRLPEQDNQHVAHPMTVTAPDGDDDGETGGDDDGETGGDDDGESGGDDDGETGGDDDGETGGDDDGETGGDDDGETGGDDDGETGGDDDGNEADDRWVTGGSGWTQFEKSADSRVIYVSSSEGDDANDGRSPEQPVRTLAKARSFTRNGYPDWILLKAGDVWVGENVGARAGRSADERALTGAYGEGPRPVIRDGSLNSIRAGRSHFAVVGLEFDTPGKHAIHWVADATDLLFEDLVIRNSRGGIVIDARTADVSNVRIRRCIIVDQYSTSSHSSGVFVNGVDGLLIEENVLDHNGWHPDIPGAEATIYNHNTYLTHRNQDVVMRGNIIARASSNGVGNRAGGIVEDNLLLRNPINISMGHHGYSWPEGAVSGVIRRNVIIDSYDTGDEGRGIGIWVVQLKDTEVHDNIIAHREHGTAAIRPLDTGWNSDGVTMRDNHVYGWGGTIDLNLERHLNLTTKNNYFDATRFSSNYFDTSMVSPNVIYNEPSRSVDTYMTEQLGLSNGSIEAFLEVVRARPRGTWNEAYTAEAVNAYVRSGFAIMPSFD